MAAYDLCSLSEVRSFLQKPTSDTDQDTIIQAIISRASLAIMRYTDREFAPATTSATRKFEWDAQTPWLSLAPYDLRTVTLFRLDSDQASPSTLTTADYRLAPRPSRDGTYTAVKLRPSSVVSPTWQFPDVREVEITGAWGFAAIPEDVKHTAIVTTATWLRRDVSAFSQTFNLNEDRVERPEFLPSAIARQLDHYKRHSYA